MSTIHKESGDTVKKLAILLPSGIISMLMIMALFDNPYGFYQFLRIIIPLLAGFVAYKIYQHDEDSKYVWFFVGVAVLFNPLAPIYLDRSVWAVLNLAIAIVSPIVAMFVIKGKRG